jgi:polyisoprenoid-binding protein YceI
MLASQNLAAEEHPDIQFRSTSVESSNEQSFLLRGSLTIRGGPQTVSLPVSFKPLGGQSYHFLGQFPVKQSSYGIKPESVGGVVNVKDEVMIFLDIYATPTAKTCE